jgi:hypothetical protein
MWRWKNAAMGPSGPETKNDCTDEDLHEIIIPDSRVYLCLLWLLQEGEARRSVVVKALCHKPEGREFETRWGEFMFQFI